MATQADRKYSVDEIADIAKALGISDRALASAEKADPLHGLNYNSTDTYGVLTHPGVRPQMFSAMSRPMSLARLLTPVASDVREELLEIQTGVTDNADSNAANYCADPPGTGQMKVCQQIIKYGQYFQETGVNVLPQIGSRRTRADVPRQILNMAPSQNPLIPEMLFNLVDTRSQIAYELFLLGRELELSLEKVLVQGNNATAYTSTQRGWIAEFNGLDQWVKTGYTDAQSPNPACPAMDSTVISYSTTLAGTIVSRLNDLWWSVSQRADAVGMGGTQWAFVMHPWLFRALVDVVSDQYSVVRVTGAQYEEANRDSEAMVARADAMLNGRFLYIMGMTIPVILSHGTELTTTASDTYRSDIYLLPLDWQGVPLTRLDYFNLDNGYLREFEGFVTSDVRPINGGLFLAGKVRDSDSAFCPKIQFASMMRLILETPWLAGRIDDITFSYTANTPSPYAGESLHVNGGVTVRS